MSLTRSTKALSRWMPARSAGEPGRPERGIAARARTAVLCLAMFGMTPAFAGIGGSVVPSFPTPLNVGDIKTATITITNRATTPNNTENVSISGIFFTPSCSATDGFSCQAPDPGVFQFATVVGKVGSSCASTPFSLGTPNPSTGEFELIPSRPIVLGPANGSGPLPKVCTISINFKVLRAPQDSTPADTKITTVSLARASLQGTITGTQGGATGGNVVAVNSTAGNQSPVADAGAPQFTQTLIPVSLSGSASSDPDGTIASYAWAFGDGTSGSGANVSHTYLSAGIYTATLTVTDNSGATATDSVTINVGNRAPVADAGANQSSSTKSPASFNGSGSSDPDGTIASYAWNFGDGTSGSGVSVTHAYQAAGTYTASLTVTDNSGATATDSVVVTVTDAPPATGAYRWSKQFGGTGAAAAYGTTHDAAGNLVVVGAFSGSASFGGATLTSAGSTDIFVGKYSATGAHVWSKRFGGTHDDSAQSVAVDASGNVYVSGYFKNTVDFGGGPLTAYYSGFGGQMRDAFIAKFSPSGAHLWSRKFGSFGQDTAYGIAVDGSGNLVVTGTFIGPVDFGGTSLASVSDSADVFVAKYSPAGQLVWAKKFGNGSADTGYGIAVDGAGNIAVVGSFTGSADFGGGTLTSAGGTDIVVFKLSASGTHLWSRRFGNTGQDVGFALATDGGGNVFVTGYFQGEADFGGGLLSGEGSLDTFVAKFSSGGSHQWSYALGGTNADEGFGIATDASGNVLIVGAFQGSADFGSGVLTSVGGSWDVVAIKYSAGGTPLWSKRFGGPADDMGYAVVADASGNATFVGTFQSTADFGGASMTASGYNDVFVVNLAP